MSTDALTREQADAVAGRGVVFVSAGAGTGKTSVLIARVRQALVDGVDPERLLVVTYTERAARELVERLGRDLDERTASRVDAGTIHRFCRRLLREEALAAGVSPDFRVLDEAEAEILRAEAYEAALRDAVREEADETLDLLTAYGSATLRTMLDAVHHRLRAAGRPLDPPSPQPPDLTDGAAAALDACDAVLAVTADEAVALAAERLKERIGTGEEALLADLSDVRLPRAPAHTAYEERRLALERQALAAIEARQHRRFVSLLVRFDRAYALAKRSEGAVDFDDLQLRARDLLRDDARVRARVQDRYRQLLVDEFQDTNRLQCELVDLIAGDGAERFCVGDELQSIYRFRHAEVAVFVERREQADVRLPLVGNFRSRREVLDVINHLFATVLGDDFRRLVPLRRFDKPPPEHPVEICIVDGHGVGADAWRRAEADLLAERVREAIVDGHKPEEIVLLLRAGTDADLYEAALRRAGIDAYAAIGRGYYGRQQVIDLCAYLRLLRNRYDDRALLTVLASPFVGVSNDGLWNIRRAARAGIFYAIERTLPPELSERDLQLVSAFRQRYERLLRAATELDLEALCERIVAEHDYDLACLAQPDGIRRYANLRKLIGLARDYEALRGPDLPGFLGYVDAQGGAGAREAEAPVAEEEQAGAVRLMTIHAAKGLEFPVVVVADCGRSSPAVVGDVLALPDGRIGLKVPDASGQLREPATYRAVRDAERTASREEQRRLLYVAMTRAIDRLIIGGGWSPRNDSSPLRWVLDGLGIEVDSLEPGEPSLHELPEGGGRVRVWLRRAAADLEEQDAVPPEQLSLLDAALEPVPESIAPPVLEPLPLAPIHVAGEVSYSSLVLHERCPYRYFAERVLGLRPVDRRPEVELAPDRRLNALEIGDAVHAVLETDGQVDLDGRFAGGLAAGDRSLIDGFVGGWRGSALAARVAGLADVRRELAFAFVAGGVVFRGRIDLCGTLEDGSLIVVDYKTNAIGESSPETIVAADYRLQQLVYAVAALRTGVPAVEVCFAFLERAEEPFSIRYEAADEPLLTAELQLALDRLRSSDFAPRPGPICADCGALDRICAGPRLGWDGEP